MIYGIDGSVIKTQEDGEVIIISSKDNYDLSHADESGEEQKIDSFI